MNRFSACALLFFLCLAYASSQSEKITGYWLTEEGNSQLQIFKATDGKYYGEIVWLRDNKDARDDKNPDPALKSRKILGIRLLKGFVWSASDKEWQQGTIYDPDSGNLYDCFMWFDGDYSRLKIKGYIMGMRFMGRETTWTRENKMR
jgi:uncharacterized protein (DUF2147 family)